MEYMIPATSQVDNGLCNHSRIVRKLVPLLLFPRLLIPCKLITAYCGSFPALHLYLVLYQRCRRFSLKTPEIWTNLSRETSTSPALCNSLRADDTPLAKALESQEEGSAEQTGTFNLPLENLLLPSQSPLLQQPSFSRRIKPP